MFEKTTQESFRLLFDIHVMGAFNVTQAALPYIPTDGTGRIVNVTSAAGLTGTLGQVNYSRPKRASSASPNRWRANWPPRTSRSMRSRRWPRRR